MGLKRIWTVGKYELKIFRARIGNRGGSWPFPFASSHMSVFGSFWDWWTNRKMKKRQIIKR